MNESLGWGVDPSMWTRREANRAGRPTNPSGQAPRRFGRTALVVEVVLVTIGIAFVVSLTVQFAGLAPPPRPTVGAAVENEYGVLPGAIRQRVQRTRPPVPRRRGTRGDRKRCQ